MLAPMQLDNYFVEELSFTSSPELSKAKRKPTEGMSIAFDIRRKGKEPIFLLSMFIKLPDVGLPKKNMYNILLKIHGFFSFKPDIDEKTIERMISFNGLAILYGVARGVVAQVTANGPHGKYILPAVDFVAVIKSQLKETKRKKIKKTKKKKVSKTKSKV